MGSGQIRRVVRRRRRGRRRKRRGRCGVGEGGGGEEEPDLRELAGVSGQGQQGECEGGGGVQLHPEGGQGAKEGVGLHSRRGWREESQYLPDGWRMGTGGWMEGASFLQPPMFLSRMIQTTWSYRKDRRCS